MEEIKSIELIKNERLRQINDEGYSWRHDDQETNHQLSDAAIVYACAAPMRYEIMHKWPWDEKYYKPDTTYTINGRIRELTKAGALICAEIDRLIRLKDEVGDKTMTRKEAKELLPVIKAFADDKTIQYETRDGWIDLDSLYPHSDILSKYRIKPAPKYRPFKTKEECWNEMLKHQPFGWVKSKKSERLFSIGLVFWDNNFNDVYVTFACNEMSSYCSKTMIKDFTFADGTPFGIKEE